MSKWYVVYTRPNQEQRAEVNLARQGYRTWLPVMERSRRRAKRFESGHAPLFPQYLFVELDIGREPWRAINGTFGVKRLLADGPRPRALPEEFVAALREADRGRRRKLARASRFEAGGCRDHRDRPLRGMRGGRPASCAAREGRGAAGCAGAGGFRPVFPNER